MCVNSLPFSHNYKTKFSIKFFEFYPVHGKTDRITWKDCCYIFIMVDEHLYADKSYFSGVQNFFLFLDQWGKKNLKIIKYLNIIIAFDVYFHKSKKKNSFWWLSHSMAVKKNVFDQMIHMQFGYIITSQFNILERAWSTAF